MLLSKLDEKCLASGYCSPTPSLTPRLNDRDDGSSIQEYLLKQTGQRTVPSVFVSEYTMPWLFLSTVIHCAI